LYGISWRGLNLEKAAENIKRGNVAPVCNMCGKKIKVENDILKEDLLEVTKEWGYFSDRDTLVHHFNLCEACYNELISQFKIPVEVRKDIEVL
jgi:hypothetical protein